MAGGPSLLGRLTMIQAEFQFDLLWFLTPIARDSDTGWLLPLSISIPESRMLQRSFSVTKEQSGGIIQCCGFNNLIPVLRGPYA
jgi:hypothetical protein